MKKILTVLLACVLLFSLASCASKTPYIGENGNWWIGDEDLGVAAQGPQGEQGIQGEKGDKGDQGEQGPQGEYKTPEFIVGEKVTCRFGESFEMNIMGTDDMAYIQKFLVTKNREADPNNLEDYWYSGSSHYYYKQYIYDVHIEGKVDSKYAGKTIYVVACFSNDETTWTHGENKEYIVSTDGTFVMDFCVHDNQNENLVVPQHIYIPQY